MRLTTEIWVSAVLRRAFSSGGFAAVVRRGASEAGAVLITQRDRLGETRLYGPAPQSAYDEARPEQRQFSELLRTQDPDEIDDKINRETRFDPDLWVVELEVDDALLAELVPVTML